METLENFTQSIQHDAYRYGSIEGTATIERSRHLSGKGIIVNMDYNIGGHKIQVPACYDNEESYKTESLQVCKNVLAQMATGFFDIDSISETETSFSFKIRPSLDTQRFISTSSREAGVLPTKHLSLTHWSIS